MKFFLGVAPPRLFKELFARISAADGDVERESDRAIDEVFDELISRGKKGNGKISNLFLRFNFWQRCREEKVPK